MKAALLTILIGIWALHLGPTIKPHHKNIPIAVGLASWYSRASSGTITASGVPLRDDSDTCAMRHTPFNTRVLVVTRYGYKATCTVRDRGPYVAGRVIDVTPHVRDELHFSGIVAVTVYKID